METGSIAGEYYLQNVREMASAFLLKPDHTFRFFFSYGALDRVGAGEWELKNDQILLNSTAHPGNAFTLVSSEKKDQPFINITIEGSNPMILAYTYISLQDGGEDSWKKMSQHGDLRLPPQVIKNISLLFEFCPDRMAVITATEEHNSFTFRMEPSIGEVYFDKFSLDIRENELKGRHPLMEGDGFRYAKQ